MAATFEQAQEALHALYTTPDAGVRKQADEWLRGLQDSSDGWRIGVDLVSEGRTAEAKLFGATLLCNKLRGGSRGPSSDPHAAGGMAGTSCIDSPEYSLTTCFWKSGSHPCHLSKLERTH